MKRWVRWQDWVAGLAGLYTVLATLWTRQGGASTALMIVFGLLLVAAAVVDLAMPGLPGVEWAQLVLAVLLFLAPWFGAYADRTGAAWTSWIMGLIAAVVSAIAIKPSMDERRHHMPRLSH
jgi:membrane associated rhomboid family serine protease